MKVVIILFIIIVLLLSIKVALVVTEYFDVPEYLKHKTKCYSCETDIRKRYGMDAIWFAQPSKLYSGEQQGVDMYGEEGGFIGKTIKYY
jgi:hypothetical protein